jgi:DNA-binding CsgD family transcriptional regulator
MVGCVRDVTEERRAQREIAAHFAVSEALTDWTALLPGATDLLRRLGEAMECQMGVMWIPDGPLLVSRVLWHSPSLDAAALEPIVAERRLPRGVGLPGRVWESAEPRVSKPLDDAPQAVRAAVARAGLTGSLALPALAARGVLVVLEFHCQEKVELSERLARSLTGIGYELGAFLARRHGELVPSVLTPRELEVLQLAAGGYPRREVADRLMVSPSTIKTHLEHIYAKLGVSDRAAAVAQGLRTGLIE